GDGRVFRLGDGPDAPEGPTPPIVAAPRGPLRFEAIEPEAAWQAAVRTTTAAIREGVAAKVVLARRELAPLADAAAHAPAVLGALRAEHPRATVFGLRPGGALGWFVGAPPETLCRREDGWVMTEALAGTSTGGPEGLDNPKERAEHRW